MPGSTLVCPAAAHIVDALLRVRLPDYLASLAPLEVVRVKE